MARIYIDARTITEEPSGVGRYARSLLPELIDGAPDDEYVVVRHASNRERLGLPEANVETAFVDVPIGDARNVLAGAFRLRPLFERYGPPDLYHSLFHLLPVGLTALLGDRAPTVVTVHDFVWIDHASAVHDSRLQAAAKKLFGRLAIPYALRRADHVIAVSEPTARRAEAWIEADKQTVVPHGVSRELFDVSEASIASPPDWLPESRPFALAVGNDKPYKNLDRLVSAFATVRRRLGEPHLVLIGGCDGLRDRIASLGLEEAVHLPGFVGDEELRAAFAGASVFVFPSLVEGFGLPILEAMAAGVPTVVSDREPMRSVAGDAAITVDPLDTGALGRELVRLFQDADLRGDLAEQGRAHADRFRWSRAAERTRRVYDTVLGRRERS